MRESLPDGNTLVCYIVFLEGEVSYKTDKKTIEKKFQYSGDIKELKNAKKSAYEYFVNYIAKFDEKYPDGYIMLHKVEWETDASSKKETSIFMKQLEVAGVSADF